MTPLDCPAPTELEGFVAGTLPRPRMDDVAHHVSQCPDCEKALASLDGLADPLMRCLRRIDLLSGTIDFVPPPLLAAARSAREPPGPAALAGRPPARVGRFEL